MNRLKNLQLMQLLPASIAADTTVKNISLSVETILQKVAGQTAAVLLLPHLDELPEAIIDELAWQYHVDTYSADLPIGVKR